VIFYLLNDLKYRLIYFINTFMQTPSNITLDKTKTLLTLTFDGTKYPLSAEYLRVYSPSGLTKKTVITESAAFKYSVKNTILVETKKGVIRVAAAMSGVFVDMGEAIWKPKDIPFNQLKNENATHTVNGYQVGVVSMGNPHAVLIVDDINQEIESIAKKIQNSGDFPDGVNVSFVQITHEFKVKLRVYERGVGETLACGSGACATVAYLDLIGRVNAKDKDVIVDLKGGVLSIGVNEGDRMVDIIYD
jgi:diaminopimelate epimerase